jgi:alkylmercury lyase
MIDAPDINELAERLTAAMPRLDATEQCIALTLIRQLALGAPVSVSQLATTAQLPEPQITETLDQLPGVFRDEQQRVVGFMGLTVVEMGHHRIHVDGRPLSAWCAWDTLFLPQLLDQTAYVTSRSPASDEQISVTVTPTGPTDLTPADTVVSFLLPETEFDADVIQRFCHFVHFFASPAAGEQWTAEHPGTFLLSVEDAYRLGVLTNRAAFGAAMSLDARPACA